MNKPLTILLFGVLMMGCTDTSTFVAVCDLPRSTWSDNEAVTFDFNTAPSHNGGDIRLNFRYEKEAVGLRRKLFVKTTNEQNFFHIDTLDWLIARGSGNEVRSMEIRVRRDIAFQLWGRHTIALSLDSTLSGILSVGVEVDNAYQYGQR